MLFCSCHSFWHLWLYTQHILHTHHIFRYSLLLPVPLQLPPGSSVDMSRAARRHRNTSQQGHLLLSWKGRREALAAPTLARHCSALIGIFGSEYICEWVCMCVGVWVCGWGGVHVGECRMVSSFMFQSVREHWHKVQFTCQQSPHTTWLVLVPLTHKAWVWSLDFVKITFEPPRNCQRV